MDKLMTQEEKTLRVALTCLYGGANESVADDIKKKALAVVDALKKQRDEARQWVEDLQTGMYINCVYCGYRYEPGTPAIRSEVLYEHIRKCPKHPLSAAEKKVREERAAREHILTLLRETKIKHGLCQPRSRKACTACSAKEELDKIVTEWEGVTLHLT